MDISSAALPGLSHLNGKPILLGFDDAEMSSNAGLALLREIEPRGLPHLEIKIAIATLEVTGVRISLHLIRDAAATTLTRLSPKSARLITPVLAHSSFETAEKFYIQAGSIDAGRTYAALIRARRKSQ